MNIAPLHTSRSWRRAASSLLLLGLGLVVLQGCAPEAGGADVPATESAPPIEAAVDRTDWPIEGSVDRTDWPIEGSVDRTDWPRIVALGDSLTAGLGLAAAEAYPARLQARIDAAGYRWRVVNAGTSGDTTAGGLRRLAFALEGDADVGIVIVALGGNDGLRGLPVDQMRDNLSQIIKTAEQRGARVVLAGMEAPPNFGAAYTTEFRQVFHDLAAEYDVAFVPFLLEGVAGVAALNQPDGIHPNAEGAERVAAHLWSTLHPMLQEDR